MSNEIRKPEPNYFEEYGQAVAGRNIVGDLLTFNKFGEFKAGAEKADVPIDTLLVAHMPTLMVGFIKWVDNKPVDYAMGLINDGYKPPRREELGDTDKAQWAVDDDDKPRDPWQLSNYLVMSDPDSDQLYTFATASKGWLGAIGELSTAYGKRIRQVPGEYPRIKLGWGKYPHRNRAYGDVRYPIFKVVGWVPAAKFAALVAGETVDEDADAEDQLSLSPPVPAPAPATTRATAKKSAKAPTSF